MGTIRSTFRAPSDRRSPRAVKVNTALRFGTEVLGLEGLNYGLWAEHDPLTLDGFKVAQSRYTDHLVDLVPPDVRSILDVGSGTGVLAERLLARGFEVEMLGPDPALAEKCRQRTGAPFHLGRFQEFHPRRRYDLVMMSESAQYIWLPSLFPAVRRVASGGTLLVSDYFRYDPAAVGSGHPLEEFLATADGHGCRLEHSEDITEQVLPTLHLARKTTDELVWPTVDIVRDMFVTRYPRLFPLVLRLFRRRLRKLGEIQWAIDPDEFVRTRTYRILRFRVEPPDG